MAVIPGFDIVVKRNNQEIKAVSGSVTRSAGAVGAQWQIELQEPMNIAATDTWTIQRKFAGYTQTLVENCYSTQISGSDGVGGFTRSVSGQQDSDVADLLEYCIPKTMVFFNPNWAKSIDPSARLVNGILKTGSYTGGYNAELGSKRIYWYDRLPGPEIQDDQFTCVEAYSHHDIARYIAGLLDYTIVVNTPNLELQDTFTCNAGSTWFDAIKANFQMWFPVIQTVGKTIYILDVMTDAATIAPVRTVKIDNPAILSVGFSTSGQAAKSRQIDHLMIIGKKTKHFGFRYPTEKKNDDCFKEKEKPEAPPVSPPGSNMGDPFFSAKFTLDASKTTKNKKWSDWFTGVFGDPSASPPPTPKPWLATQDHEIQYFMFREGEKSKIQWLPITETTTFKNDKNVEIGKVVTEHYYGKDLKPVRTVETEYLWTNLPKESTYQLYPLRCKQTLQRHLTDPTNITLTSEQTEELVLFEWATGQDGNEYRSEDPRPFADSIRDDVARENISTDSESKQDYLKMPTHWKESWIERSSKDFLIKRDLDYAVLSQTIRTNSQLLQNPDQDVKDTKPSDLPVDENTKKPQEKMEITVSDDIFKKDYFYGAGKMIGSYGPCYHAPHTINHQDIASEAIAEKIRDRCFARRGSDQATEMTILTPVPIPFETTSFIVRLPSFSAKVNGQTVTIAGGDYALREVQDSWSYSGEGNAITIDHKQTIKVRLKP